VERTIDHICRVLTDILFDATALRAPSGELDQLLEQSNAAPDFKADVLRFADSGRAGRIHIEGWAPPVKVTRLLKHVLASAPELELDRIVVQGRSGCSDFTGKVELHTQSETRVYDFEWCCRWRAEEEGWRDYFGLPDQIRAAREYDWRCFRRWDERESR
jgi:hypothetical protein